MFQDHFTIKKLAKEKGGYYYLEIPASLAKIHQWSRQTRFVCYLDSVIEFQCGLNHLGNGNFYIIISKDKFNRIGKNVGDDVEIRLELDSDPLGAKMPEVLEILLTQETELNEMFESFSAGGKRTIIHTISRIKDLDKQIETARLSITEKFYKTSKKIN